MPLVCQCRLRVCCCYCCSYCCSYFCCFCFYCGCFYRCFFLYECCFRILTLFLPISLSPHSSSHNTQHTQHTQHTRLRSPSCHCIGRNGDHHQRRLQHVHLPPVHLGHYGQLHHRKNSLVGTQHTDQRTDIT